MADFCFQCNIDLYFGPHSDYSELPKGSLLRRVLCEGCGPTIVDWQGRCVDDECYLHGPGAPEERLRAYARAGLWVSRRSGPLGRLYRLLDRLRGTPWEPGLLQEWKLRRDMEKWDKGIPSCFYSQPNPQEQAENECGMCDYWIECNAVSLQDGLSELPMEGREGEDQPFSLPEVWRHNESTRRDT